jgi:hypothetical protein
MMRGVLLLAFLCVVVIIVVVLLLVLFLLSFFLLRFVLSGEINSTWQGNKTKRRAGLLTRKHKPDCPIAWFRAGDSATEGKRTRKNRGGKRENRKENQLQPVVLY